MTVPLNKLETVVLQTICRQVAADTAVDAVTLEEQLRGVAVQAREKVNELGGMMTFLLFTKNGYADQLEGASFADSTVSINFSDIEFEILDPPLLQ
jgi:chemotaxis receptor (MCP) glutamine deamidase CheD